MKERKTLKPGERIDRLDVIRQGQIKGPAIAPAGMIPCPTCSDFISRQAAACPKCGHQLRSPNSITLRDPVHVIGIILAIIFGVGILLTLFMAFTG